MSKSLTITTVLIAFLFISVLLLQIDDETDPKAQTILDSIDWQTPNDTYLYFLGLSAEVSSDPLEEGEKRLKQIRANELAYDSLGLNDKLPYPIQWKELHLPDYEAFCSANEASCIPSLFVGSDIPLDDPNMRALKERYLTFMGMRGFRTLTKPHNLEVISDRYLSKGNRLVSLGAIENARRCCPEKVVSELYQLIEQQRKYLREADTLIGKMEAYALLNETIEVLSLLLRESNIEGVEISVLNSDHLNLDQAVAREFAVIKSIIDSFKIDERIPEWMLKTVYKPNITINAQVSVFEQTLRLSKLPPRQFAIEMQSPRKIDIETSWLRNSIGTVLNNASQYDLSIYIARGLDINAKIILFNSLLNKPMSLETIGSTASPYYDDKRPAKYNATGNRVCFDGPLTDPKSFRCLIVVSKDKG